MAKIITMPKLGLTMTKGKIVKWYKNENDQVKEGDKLFSVETDKLTNDIEAKDSGVLRKIIVQSGQDVPCLQAIAIIADANEDISALLSETVGEDTSTVEKKKEDNLDVKTKEVAKKINRNIKISPVAKKLAIENGIDPSEIIGTGPDGRIVLKDVDKFIDEISKIKITPAAIKTAKELGIDPTTINKDGRIRKEDIYKFDNYRRLNEMANPIDKRIPMSTMRKVIAERMTYSWNTSPVVNYDIRVDVSKLKELKNELKSVENVTFTDLIVKIVSKLLLEFPLINSSIDGEEIILRNYVNMGVAVALEDGLVVPVVKHSHIKGLKEISDEIKDLAYKAKNNQLASDELSGGTFTITNIGMFGVESFTPIINQPESAILGVNAIVETLALENGNVVKKPLMNLSLTADHRNIDGAVAAQFLAKLRQYIESPSMMLL